ncbi:fungal hydrophobin-domain-containing protein [Amylostereum chailletii]|nr:fungal hydrophobin-domain-containing protein [Amylostereum chailletii]
MFFRTTFVALVAILVSSVAAHPSASCGTGAIKCCNSIQPASSQDSTKALDGLDIPIESLETPIGLTCTPIPILAVNGQGCAAQTACCSGNTFNGGLVNMGCTPISLSNL